MSNNPNVIVLVLQVGWGLENSEKLGNERQTKIWQKWVNRRLN